MTTTILPDFIQQTFRTRLEELYVKAESIFTGWKFERARLDFSLRGKILGEFSSKMGICHISLHEEFCMYEYKDMLEDTLPHEVAHHLVYEVFERKLPGEWCKPKRQPHGTEWQAIAAMLGASPAARCRSGYEMSRCRKTGRIRPHRAVMAELELEKKELQERVKELGG